MPSTLTQAIERVEAHVLSQLSGRIRDFRISVRDNGLVLHGQVRSYYAKQLAQHLVMEALDAPILANEIEVQ